MTDYTKTTDFTSKDSLPSGDSGKIIRGAEFGTEFDNIQTAVNSKSNKENPSFTGNITVTGTVDGRDISADGTKLDTIETSADVTDTANVTAAGAVMDSELTDITAVKALNQGVATTDSPTFAAVTSTGNVTVGGTVDGRDVAADGTKLDTVETNADVTDTTNVTAAGALMDSEVTNLAQVKAFDSADYATAAQGTTADNALPKTGGAMTGAITTNSTFDGRDVATDGTKLDGIEALADVTDTTNVTAAGALMDSELTDLTAVKSLDQGVATTDSPTFAGLTTTADVSFGDNDKAIFGAGSDLQIYHDGTHSNIKESGAGDLQIFGDNVNIYNAAGSQNLINLTSGGANTLFHNGSARLATTATGIDVTGTATMDGLVSSGDSTIGGSSATSNVLLDLVEPTSSSDIILGVSANGSGRTQIRSTQGLGTSSDLRLLTKDSGSTRERLKIANNGDISFYEDTGTTAKFQWFAAEEQLQITTGSTGAGGWSENLYLKAANYPSLRFWETTSGDVSSIGNNGDGSLYFSVGGTTGVLGTTGMVINSSGNVGIGESSPTGAFHVSRSGLEAGITLERTTSATAKFTMAANDGNLVFTDQNQSAERMRIDSSGVLKLNQSRSTYVDATEDASARSHMFVTNADVGDFSQEAGHLVIQARTHTSVYRDIIFAGGVGSASDLMRITGEGNVGIGTDSPTDTLSVGTLGSGSNSIITIGASTTGTSSVYFGDGASAARFRGYFDYVHSSDHLAIGTAGTERMRIDSSGNLLVGKTAANNTSQGVTIYGAIAPGAASFVRDSGNTIILNRLTTDGEILAFRKDGTAVGSIGTVSGLLGIGSGDAILAFDGTGNAMYPMSSQTGGASDGVLDFGSSLRRFKDLYLSGGATSGTSSNFLRFLHDGSNGIIDNTAGYLVFRRSGFAESMRLDASGNLLVGRTTTINFPTNTTSGIRLGANRFDMAADSLCRLTQLNNASGEFDRFYIGSSIIGSITGSGSTTSYNTSSDQRLKDNIVDAPSASDDIDAIQVRSFDWKADGSHQKYGMVAQELNTVAPEAVSEGATEEDMMGVDYSKLVPMLVKEIQSLRARVAQLGD